MKYKVVITKCSDNFYDGCFNYPNTTNCFVDKIKDGKIEFFSNDLEQFCLFCSSDFFKSNVFEYEQSSLRTFAVTSVWNSPKGNFQHYLSIVEGVDFDHAKGKHITFCQNDEKIKSGGHTLFTILIVETDFITLK